MIKYVPEMTSVVIEEIPDKLTLAVEISNCQGTCMGCHSPFLRANIGEELTPTAIDRMIADNFGVNCFLLLGEGNDHEALLEVARYLKNAHPKLSRAIYSGRKAVEDDLWEIFDYIKIGPYIPECGPLNNPHTNQRLYMVQRQSHREQPLPKSPVATMGLASESKVPETAVDITYRFWHKGIDPNR